MSRRLAIAVAALMLAVPATATAQPEDPGRTPPLEETPPPGGPPADDAGEGSQAEPARPSLPATGQETWLIALTGAGMVMSGIGLRMRLSVA